MPGNDAETCEKKIGRKRAAEAVNKKRNHKKQGNRCESNAIFRLVAKIIALNKWIGFDLGHKCHQFK